MEERVSIGRLKTRLSEYLRRTRAGEAVVITDRGRPVARLVPLEGDVALEGRTAELVRAGLARKPERGLDLDALPSIARRTRTAVAWKRCWKSAGMAGEVLGHVRPGAARPRSRRARRR